MKKILFLLILALPISSFAGDFFGKRLKSLYETDKKKCLETSKKYIKWFPEKASSYYYASVIYQEKSTKSRTVQGAYRNLRHAIGYAIKFEEKDVDMNREKLGWEQYKSKVTAQATELVERLNDLEEYKYSESLLARVETFDKTFTLPEGDLLAENIDDNAELGLIKDDVAEVPEIATSKVVEFERIEGHFYGMPTGREAIASADLGAELKVISLINQERRKKGLDALEWDEDLTKACRYHAYDLATQNYFNHDTHDRKNGELVKVGSSFDRIKKFYNKSFINAENIAAGNIDPEMTYKQWEDSPGHYENMFNPDSKKVGIGVYYDPDSPFGYYWAFCTAL